MLTWRAMDNVLYAIPGATAACEAQALKGWRKEARLTEPRAAGAGYGDCFSVVAALLHGSAEWPQHSQSGPTSYDANGVWASQRQHAVQNMDGDANFCGATLVLAKTQPITDDLLVASDGGLHASSLVIA